MTDEPQADPLTILSAELDKNKSELAELQKKLEQANANMMSVIDANKRLLAVSRQPEPQPPQENHLDKAIKIFRKELNIGD